VPDDERRGFVSKVIGSKQRWREYKARVRQLPPDYRVATEAVERYLMHFVPDGRDSVESQFEDLVDLFEQAAADRTPIRDIVGEDPVEFAEAFAQNYTKGGYVPDRERERLTASIDRAASGDTSRDRRAKR
jgi:DNA-binding ferritin-like protein (Dps family)